MKKQKMEIKIFIFNIFIKKIIFLIIMIIFNIALLKNNDINIKKKIFLLILFK